MYPFYPYRILQYVIYENRLPGKYPGSKWWKETVNTLLVAQNASSTPKNNTLQNTVDYTTWKNVSNFTVPMMDIHI